MYPLIEEDLEDQLVKLAEECDSLHGIMVIAGLGGASGAALQANIMRIDGIFGKNLTSWNVMPSVNQMNDTFSLYNMVFGFYEMVEYLMCTIYDTAAL